MRITNKNELRGAYKSIRFIEETFSELGIGAITNEHLKELKREVRRYTKKNRNLFDIGYFKYESRCVKGEGIDGYVELVLMPEGIKSLEEARQIFDEYLWIPPYYTYYDCTGKPFSRWYHMFKRNGRYMAYHSVGFDV